MTFPVEAKNHDIILFDGVCNLCNATVNFIIRHDRKDIFRFAPLQSSISHELLTQYKIKGKDMETIILIKKERIFTRSTAVIKIAGRLQGGWKLFYGMIIIPKFLRDGIYQWISKHRYHWFGRKESCMVPSPTILYKFIE
jgi:predicted DCC family thiol-disulfide oxidoreductase YuxK